MMNELCNVTKSDPDPLPPLLSSRLVTKPILLLLVTKSSRKRVGQGGI